MSQKIMGPQNSTKLSLVNFTKHLKFSKKSRKRLKKYCQDDEFVHSFYVLHNFFYWYANERFDTFIQKFIYMFIWYFLFILFWCFMYMKNLLSGVSSSYYFDVHNSIKTYFVTGI